MSDINNIINPENLVYKKAEALSDNIMHYCPGCSHGVVHKLIAETIDELDIRERTIGVSPVGCGVFAYNYVDCDWQQAAHGRAPALATGAKRLLPDHFVFTYQGDGDLASIGTSEIMHAVNRGENITVIFINNGIYGMTGGQMSPTTLVGMETSSSPFGRDIDVHGYPIKITEMLAQLHGAAYITRQSVHTAAAVRKAKKAIKKAFEVQEKAIGTSFVEIVSTCSSGWKMSPTDSNDWMAENMFKNYPLGDIVDKSKPTLENLDSFSLK